MKTTIKCPHCPRSFTGEFKTRFAAARLKANLANHIKGSHPEHYVPKVKLVKVEPITDINWVGEAPAATRRPYTHKSKPESSVNFCPGCGCNLRAVKVAMGL